MKGVDLFCGCGGLSRGFEDAGVRLLEAYDCWLQAVDCYNLNFSHKAVAADLTDVDGMAARLARLAPDIIIGGPPCQDFSQAGKRQEGVQANLTECYARIVAKALPKWFVMENVDRAQRSRAYRQARRLLAAAGYGMTEKVLNASDYGVPQNRRRFFCIGLLGAADGFLAEDLDLHRLEEPVTVREHFAKVGHAIEVEHYYRHPRNYSRRGVFSIDEPAPTMRGVNRPIPGGYAGHDGDTHQAAKVRPLSTRERALIQTFPPDFQLQGAKTVVEQLIGNAVPVKLAAVVAGSLLAYEQVHGAETRRGRKAVKEAVQGVERDDFMRWVIAEKRRPYRKAKDTWSWLSRASGHAVLDDDALDDEEVLFLFTREAGSAARGAAMSRMKSAVRLYREFRRRDAQAKNPSLFA